MHTEDTKGSKAFWSRSHYKQVPQVGDCLIPKHLTDRSQYPIAL